MGDHGGRECPLHPKIFFETSPIKTNALHGAPPHLKIKAPNLRNNLPYWKVKSTSRIWFLEKYFEKSETVIDTCVSIIKQYWKKTAEIPQECDFITWSNRNFVQKVKQFLKQYHVTWLITQLVVIKICIVNSVTCNCLLVDM